MHVGAVHSVVLDHIHCTITSNVVVVLFAVVWWLL